MTDEPLDVGAYCREIEDHLTRVNRGHLVRIVGPSFELVRQWADERIPLSVVRRGIDRKVERRRAAQQERPVRLEFCEADVREIFDGWRRAIGMRAAGGAGESGAEPAAAKRPSLARHLDRAVDQLGRVAGRLDLPESLRDALAAAAADVAAIREDARHVRGPARSDLAARLPAIDAGLLQAARGAAAPALLRDLRDHAERDLAPFRERLGAASWDRAVETTVDRLLRERLGLPAIEA